MKRLIILTIAFTLLGGYIVINKVWVTDQILKPIKVAGISTNTNSLDGTKTLVTNSITESVSTQITKQATNNIYSTNNAIKTFVNTIAESINKEVDKKTQAVVNNVATSVLGTDISGANTTTSSNSNQEQTIKVAISTNTQANISSQIIIDFASQVSPTNFLKLVANKSYDFKFANIPKNVCLYVNDKKYFLDKQTVINIVFQRNGEYSLILDVCNPLEKVVQKVIVE